MKNRFFKMGIIALTASLAAISPAAAAETGKGFFIGVNAGGGPVASAGQSWRAGLEAGYRIAAHLAVAVDVSFGGLTLENSSSSGSYQAKDSQKWTTNPVTLAVLYAEPLGERTVVYLGAGLGWHGFTRTLTSETNASGTPQTTSQKSTFRATAPQIVLGLEFGLFKFVSLTGTLKYDFGTASRKDQVSRLETAQDINFGGASFVVGLRVRPF
jgi:opacity protein-like surface antigen